VKICPSNPEKLVFMCEKPFMCAKEFVNFTETKHLEFELGTISFWSVGSSFV
jgi:hypothetical protein